MYPSGTMVMSEILQFLSYDQIAQNNWYILVDTAHIYDLKKDQPDLLPLIITNLHYIRHHLNRTMVIYTSADLFFTLIPTLKTQHFA